MKIEVSVPDIDEYQFLNLAKKYARHYHDIRDDDCMVCEAIKLIDGGQMEVAIMLSGRETDGKVF